MDLLAKIPPHALWVLLTMTGFGVYWKKSRWPNGWFGLVNLVISMVVYPALELSISDEPQHLYRNPTVVLTLAGAAIGIGTFVLHNTIVAAAKKLGIEFPEETDPPKP